MRTIETLNGKPCTVAQIVTRVKAIWAHVLHMNLEMRQQNDFHGKPYTDKGLTNLCHVDWANWVMNGNSPAMTEND